MAEGGSSVELGDATRRRRLPPRPWVSRQTGKRQVRGSRLSGCSVRRLETEASTRGCPDVASSLGASVECLRQAVGSCPELSPLVTGVDETSIHADAEKGVAVGDAQKFIEKAGRKDTTVDLFVQEASDVPGSIGILLLHLLHSPSPLCTSTPVRLFACRRHNTGES